MKLSTDNNANLTPKCIHGPKIAKKEQKVRFRTELLLSVVCLLVFTSCSSVDGVHQATANLVARDQGSEKVENPRVHPGQPIMGLPEL